MIGLFEFHFFGKTSKPVRALCTGRELTRLRRLIFTAALRSLSEQRGRCDIEPEIFTANVAISAQFAKSSRRKVKETAANRALSERLPPHNLGVLSHFPSETRRGHKKRGDFFGRSLQLLHKNGELSDEAPLLLNVVTECAFDQWLECGFCRGLHGQIDGFHPTGIDIPNVTAHVAASHSGE